ncbi:M15 family metallopeptidase [Actinotalea sp. Marseille-Q4924]|uniref:M15 family metallopeptidase n=1 Tax=Actinotalea sp. Marseille-Q4924 TaxID=2866571 RepID=UPI001CE43506|nr:M15 family metallopeptidase [Actinotalea sp. Marseille-Q4924]
MGALAATVMLSGGATASAAGAIPGGSVVPDGRTIGDAGAAMPAAQLLEARADEWSRARLDDAVAVGRAALAAADASSALVTQASREVSVASAGSTPAPVVGFEESVDALRALLRTHEGTTVTQRAGGASLVLPDSVTPPPALTVSERLAVAEEVAALAADVFRVALEVEATATATTGPGLPGLDAPPLQLTRPRPLEALAVPPPAPPAAQPAPTEPGAVDPAAAAGTTDLAQTDVTAPQAAAPAAPPEAPAAPAEPGAAPAAPEAPAAPAEPAAPDALPVEVADGLADLEAAVAAASGAVSTELTTLEAMPVLPSALAASRVVQWESFLPASLSTLGMENGRIPTALLCAPAFAPDFLLRCDAAAALEAVNEAYTAEFGEDLVVSSGYRTFEEQASLKATKGWLAAPAGRSNHGLGIAVDLGGFGGLGQFDSPRYRWMLENGEEFGWVHPEAMRPGGSGPPEPWHFEFGTE